MQKLKNICCTLICALVLTGCVFGKTSKPTGNTPINPGVHHKVLLKIQGPSENLEAFTTNLTQLSYVHDVAVVPQTGAVMICLVAGMTYDIVELQKIAADSGYVILKAGKIVW